MALIFYTDKPKTLLAEFKKKIDEKKIVTWSYDSDGDFTHSADQWKQQAWFKPAFTEAGLEFYIMPPRGKTVSSAVYGVYHGRLIESMVIHCDQLFSNGAASALPRGKDKIASVAA